MLGCIVKILDKPKGMSIRHTRSHSIGDYGIVVETSRLSVQVKTAHDTMAWYLKGEVEVYSRTPVDLIIKDGKSLPANKQAVDKSISQSSSGFKNSRELHNTYVSVKNKDEWDKAREFYKERGFSVNYKYFESFKYLRTYSIDDDAGAHTGSGSGSLDGCKDITEQVLGVTGAAAFKEGDKVTYHGGSLVGTINKHMPSQASEWFVIRSNKTSGNYKAHELRLRSGPMFDEPHQFKVGDVVEYTSGKHGWHDNNPKDTQGVVVRIDKPNTDLYIIVRRPNDMENSYAAFDLTFIRDQFMTEYYCHFLDSNSTPMETQSLEQLKFNKYVEENKDDIVDLSEAIDSRLVDLNNLGHTCGDLYITVKSQAAKMAHAFDNHFKIGLVESFDQLKRIEALFNSKEYAVLVEATKALDKKIEALSFK